MNCTNQVNGWCRYNIDSHKDGRRVSYNWVKGLLDEGHTVHCATRLGVVAVRPCSKGIRVDFQPYKSHDGDSYALRAKEESICTSEEWWPDLKCITKAELIIWILERLNGGLQPGIDPNDCFELWSNQADRDAVVLATIGTEVLAEYTMPGTTSGSEHTAISKATWIEGKRVSHWVNVGYNRCPKKWIKAIREAGLEWDGISQRGDIPFPAE